jgi:hypothetical protein
MAPVATNGEPPSAPTVALTESEAELMKGRRLMQEERARTETITT